ncbi:HNH endonuclease [Halobacteria archaeon AArc-curdl1]|uniref:HNH endonuclease n=1 Tax=Natronosalvus hydrolyticus TaxID=2979988 RepID=A0AAP2Z9E9_9EURY|nr:HNH endonuclease [Halobacteria archaeon AArc-curdl1]
MIVASRYPPDWDSRRRNVYKRDDYTCQNCGVKGGPRGNTELHAHHIVPISDGGSHKKTNLKTLCKDCHNAIHNENLSAPTAGSNEGKGELKEGEGTALAIAATLVGIIIGAPIAF